MKDKVNIEELFSKTLSEHQVSVRPELWNAIQAKVAVNATTVAGTSVVAKSLLLKGIIGLSALTVIATGAYLLMPSSESATKQTQPILDKHEISTTQENSNQEKVDQSTKTIHVQQEKKQADKASTSVAQPLSTQEEHANDIEEFAAPEKPKQTITVVETTKPTINNNKSTTKEISPVIKPENKSAEIVKTTPAKETTNTPQSFVKTWDKTNVFTPNNDGVNDYFFVETGELKEFSISILDMNNNVVFVSEDPKFQWDGTNYRTGEKVANGNYSYIIYAVGLNGEQIKQFNLLYITK